MAQNVSYSQGKLYDSIKNIGRQYFASGPPTNPDPITILQELDDAIDNSTYLDTTSLLQYQKIDGVWGAPVANYSGGGGGGGITNIITNPTGTGTSVLQGVALGVATVRTVNSGPDGTLDDPIQIRNEPNNIQIFLNKNNTESLLLLKPNNFNAPAPPTTSHNSLGTADAVEYQVGSNYYVPSEDKAYTLVQETTPGTAVWKETTVQPTDTTDVKDGNNLGNSIGVFVNVTPDPGSEGQIMNFKGINGVSPLIASSGIEDVDLTIDQSLLVLNKSQVGLSNVLNIKNDFTGSLPVPDANTDSTGGWQVGSKIIDNDNGYLWDCLDASVGDAAWSSDMGIGYAAATQINNQWNEGDIVIIGVTSVNTGSYADVSCFANNWTATTNPTTQGNDNGYITGSMWRNSITNEVFVYDNLNWNSISVPAPPQPVVNMNAASYGYLQGLSPTFNGPGTGLPIESSWYVPLRLGGAPGINATWQTIPGNQLPNNFVNANLASENLALHYVGTEEGWFTISLFINSVPGGGGPENQWVVSLWTDLVPNPLTINFLNSDAQIRSNVGTVSEIPKIGIVKSTFNKYLVPNEYIGLAVNANTANWTSTINTCSIDIIPLSLNSI